MTNAVSAGLVKGSETVEDIIVGDDAVEVPSITLSLASFGDTVIVTASRTEVRVVDAPVTTSVITGESLATTASSNVGDILRSVPGVNVIQLSARDVQVTSRQSTGTVTNSQLVLMDGRSIYLDFFGLVMWDLLPANQGDIEQIEVVRGPASATWGANAMTGAVNIITRPPRQFGGDDGDDERRLDRPGSGLDGGSGRRVGVRHKRDGHAGAHRPAGLPHQRRILELTRFRGHLSSWRGGGVHDAEVETAVPGGIPTADGRAGSVRTYTGRAGSGVRAVGRGDTQLGRAG